MPADDEQSSWVTVTFREAADVLSNPEMVRYLAHFMTAEGQTVGSLAAEFGLAPLKGFRLVKRFERLGLLTLTGERPRKGKTIKFYRCNARRWLVPHTIKGAEEFLYEKEYAEHLKRDFARSLQSARWPVQGTAIGLDAQGEPELLVVDAAGQPFDPVAAGQPALVWSLGTLKLDYAQAKQLQAELYGLLEKYTQAPGAGSYGYQFVLTPSTFSA